MAFEKALSQDPNLCDSELNRPFEHQRCWFAALLDPPRLPRSLGSPKVAHPPNRILEAKLPSYEGAEFESD